MLDPVVAIAAEGVRRTTTPVLSDRADHDPVAVDCQAAAEAVGGTTIVRVEFASGIPDAAVVLIHVNRAGSTIGPGRRDQE